LLQGDLIISGLVAVALQTLIRIRTGRKNSNEDILEEAEETVRNIGAEEVKVMEGSSVPMSR